MIIARNVDVETEILPSVKDKNKWGLVWQGWYDAANKELTFEHIKQLVVYCTKYAWNKEFNDEFYTRRQKKTGWEIEDAQEAQMILDEIKRGGIKLCDSEMKELERRAKLIKTEHLRKSLPISEAAEIYNLQIDSAMRGGGDYGADNYMMLIESIRDEKNEETDIADLRMSLEKEYPKEFVDKLFNPPVSKTGKIKKIPMKDLTKEERGYMKALREEINAIRGC
jgi:hypothetical protein